VTFPAVRAKTSATNLFVATSQTIATQKLQFIKANNHELCINWRGSNRSQPVSVSVRLRINLVAAVLLILHSKSVANPWHPKKSYVGFRKEE
jgi:hypothetical protein